MEDSFKPLYPGSRPIWANMHSLQLGLPPNRPPPQCTLFWLPWEPWYMDYLFYIHSIKQHSTMIQYWKWHGIIYMDITFRIPAKERLNPIARNGLVWSVKIRLLRMPQKCPTLPHHYPDQAQPFFIFALNDSIRCFLVKKCWVVHLYGKIACLLQQFWAKVQQNKPSALRLHEPNKKSYLFNVF